MHIVSVVLHCSSGKRQAISVWPLGSPTTLVSCKQPLGHAGVPSQPVNVIGDMSQPAGRYSASVSGAAVVDHVPVPLHG
jgi:hypothetical protein